MEIKLKKSFAANVPADEYDVRQIKKALNRLGYYMPYEKTGITGIPDPAVFAALKSFQKDQELRATGAAKPDDETISKLESEATKKKGGKYVWRTVGDERVREGHAAFNGTIRDLVDSPDPGEEFNCRCWADFEAAEQESSLSTPNPRSIFSPLQLDEQLTITKRQEIDEKTSAVQYDATGRMISPTQSEKEAKKEESSASLPAPAGKKSDRTYSNTDLLEHYKNGTGALVTITPEEMNNVPVFKDGIAKNRNSFEQSIVTGKVKGDAGTFDSPFKEKIENMKDGETIILDKNKPGKGDYWDQDIKTRDFLMKGDITGALALGDVKLRSEGQLKAERNGDKIYITGNIDHKVHNEEYNFNAEDWALKHWRDMEKKGAKPFPIKGNRKDKVEGVLTIKGGKIIDQNFKWIPADQGR